MRVGGTSAGAPQWAAIHSLGLSASNNNFYQDAKSVNYPSYFRDITSGSNGRCGFYCNAATGYDYVTGLGSPLTINYNPALSGAPNITSFAPVSPVNDTAGASRTFNITVNQTVNVTWYINGSLVQTNTGVAGAGYTNTSAALGTWNVSAIASNANGVAMQMWLWNVTPPGAPNITSLAPPSPVNDTAGASRTFNITVNQTVNVTWYINGTPKQTNTSAPANILVNYTNTSAAAGFWDVTAIAQNVNGTASHTWLWGIASLPPVLTSITISPSSVTVPSGTTQPFTAVGRDQNNSIIDLVPPTFWSSSNTTIGAINSSTGVFTASKVGTATITAKNGSSGTVSGTAAITVTAALPTATNFGVNDSQGNQNTFVLVPVNITNAQNGPIAGIVFDISFNSSVINLTSARVTRELPKINLSKLATNRTNSIIPFWM